MLSADTPGYVFMHLLGIHSIYPRIMKSIQKEYLLMYRKYKSANSSLFVDKMGGEGWLLTFRDSPHGYG